MMKNSKMKLSSVILTIALGLALMPCAFGAALSAARDTPSRVMKYIEVGIYTNTIVYAGSMVAVNSSGYIVPASDATGLQVIGRANKTVNNQTGASGAGDSGAKMVKIAIGTFGWENASTSFSDANIGDIAYVLDDQSVTNGAGSYSIIAGIVRDVDSSYVWIDCGYIDRTTGSFTTLAASGAATLSDTLEVTGATTLSSTAALNGHATLASGKDLLFAVDSTSDIGDTTHEVQDLFVDGVAHLDTVDVDQLIGLTPATLSVAPAMVVTGSTSYMKIQAAQASTCTVANASIDGQLLVLENIAATNITFSDATTSMALGSDVVLGVDDTLILLSNQAGQWRKLSSSDN